MTVQSILELFKSLPPDAQQEARDFMEFLLQKRQRQSGGKLKQDWAGAISDYRNQFTSLELQEKALEWRNE